METIYFFLYLSFAVCWRMWGLPVISLKSKQFRLERPFCRLRPFLAFPIRISASGVVFFFFFQVDACQWGGIGRAGAALMLFLLTERLDSSLCMAINTSQGPGVDISKLWLHFTQFLMHSERAQSRPCWEDKPPGTNWLQSPFPSSHTQLVSLLSPEFNL